MTMMMTMMLTMMMAVSRCWCKFSHQVGLVCYLHGTSLDHCKAWNWVKFGRAKHFSNLVPHYSTLFQPCSTSFHIIPTLFHSGHFQESRTNLSLHSTAIPFLVLFRTGKTINNVILRKNRHRRLVEASKSAIEKAEAVVLISQKVLVKWRVLGASHTEGTLLNIIIITKGRCPN